MLDSIKGQIKLPLPDLLVGIEGSKLSSNSKSYAREACRLDQGRFAHVSHFTNFVRAASGVIVKAWEHCMEISRRAVDASVKLAADPRVFAIELKHTESVKLRHEAY